MDEGKERMIRFANGMNSCGILDECLKVGMIA